MAEELGWNRIQKKDMTLRAIHFLGTMGLSDKAVAEAQQKSIAGASFLEKAGMWAMGCGGGYGGYGGGEGSVYSRAQFEAGEVEALKGAFAKRARTVQGEDRVRKDEIMDLLKEVPGYEAIPPRDCSYVLEEAGYKNKNDMGFEEFVEVSNTFFSYNGFVDSLL